MQFLFISLFFNSSYALDLTLDRDNKIGESFKCKCLEVLDQLFFGKSYNINVNVLTRFELLMWQIPKEECLDYPIIYRSFSSFGCFLGN